PVLYGLGMSHGVRGELRTAEVLAEECLQLAVQANEAEVLIPAYQLAGVIALFRGELLRAREIQAQGVALYQPQHHALTPLYGGRNLKAVLLYNLAFELWLLGYPEQARTRVNEALQLAQELNHPFSVVQALLFAAWVDLQRGEGRLAQEHADAVVR